MTFRKCLFVKKCISFISRLGLGKVNIRIDEGRRVEWKTVTENRESMNCMAGRWKSKINSSVESMFDING